MSPEELHLAYKDAMKQARIRPNRMAILLTLAADYHNPQENNIAHIRKFITLLDEAIATIEEETKP